jgi:hypothetical protein
VEPSSETRHPPRHAPGRRRAHWHGGKQITKELAKFFVEQGWIAQEQADKIFWDR